ncbi:MAG: hypothetical protein R3B45_05255 [Bdellovibrionota bacterium]
MVASKQELAEIPYIPPKDPTEELDPWQEGADSLSSSQKMLS